MSRVSINAGLLQMIVNGLKRDLAAGKMVRGEWIEEIEKDVAPIITESQAGPARLTDEELEAITYIGEDGRMLGIARAIESAVLAKNGLQSPKVEE